MKFIFLSLFSAFCMFSNAQCKYGIEKSFAFWRPQYPGNIPTEGVAKRRGGPDSIFMVYLIVNKNSNPGWTNAVVNNQYYSVLQTKVASPATVGVLVNQNDTIIIKAAKNKSIWQLTLEKSDNPPPNSFKAEKTASILLKGRFRKKNVTYVVKPIKALQPVLFM